MRSIKCLVFTLGLSLTACVPMKPEVPVAENFVFVPPSTIPATKSRMSIAILSPSQAGSFFTTRSDLKPIYGHFFSAAQADLEKIIIAKGFTTSGDYPNMDEMTFSQKERSSLILLPEINIDVALSGGVAFEPAVATVSGSVAIQFLEPMSKEKVWVKRFELPTTTNQNVGVAPLSYPNGQFVVGPNGLIVVGLTPNSTTQLLNEFYQSAFTKIWAQLDPQEIAMLKADADRLKGRTNYRAN